jgi:hypothetical protein
VDMVAGSVLHSMDLARILGYRIFVNGSMGIWNDVLTF